jgi:hypothetical protein
LRIFKTRWFNRFARREAIDDAALVDAARRTEAGLIDADLGGGLVKQRVARRGKGRSGGYRMIVAVRFGDKAFFLYGFSKSGLDNIETLQLADLKLLAGDLLAATAPRLDRLLDEKELIEIEDDD